MIDSGRQTRAAFAVTQASKRCRRGIYHSRGPLRPRRLELDGPVACSEAPGGAGRRLAAAQALVPVSQCSQGHCLAPATVRHI